MNTSKEIINLYQSGKTLQSLGEALSPNGKKIKISGVIGSQLAFLLAGLFKNQPGFFVILANDKEEAAYLQNDLEALISADRVFLLPDSFKSPRAFQRLDSGNVQQRTEIINQIDAIKQGAIIVTYPEAVFEKVVNPAQLSANKLSFQKGNLLDLNETLHRLQEFHFKREEFVYEPGQYALRGGILDIFSFGNEYPYRIEMFDEEIESIRNFNPMDQRSIRELSKVSILPNIASGLTTDEKQSLFNVLPKETVLVIKDIDNLVDKLQLCFDQAKDFADSISSLDEYEIKQILKDRSFLLPRELVEDISEFTLISPSDQKQPLSFDQAFSFHSKPQPNFNKNFQLLIEDIQKNEKEGIKTYLFTDNPKQIERFYSIFEDLGQEVILHPINHAISEGFIDPGAGIACYTDHQIFNRFHRYKIKSGFSKDKALNIRLIRELQPGDFVTHIDHGIGKYSGLETININGQLQESVRLIYKNNDILYVSINSLHKISKFVGKDGQAPVLNKLGSETWKNLKQKTKRKLKDIAGELIKLYAKRKSSGGFAFQPDGYLQNELEASFIYEDTPDQLKATNEVKEDMLKPYPMDRLICGDVGFGKTEVAIRAAFKAVVAGKQVAILVPTTILALQHYKTFAGRLADFGVTVDFLNRFKSAAEKKVVFQKLKEGSIDIVIGTHSLLNKEVGFKDLGLLIIDEEQKFGVGAKEKLRGLKVNVDTLTLTATPIPRTLQFSLMAARDLSIIRTPPPNRQPIHTETRIFNEDVVKEAIYYEINRGGQVFFVHNRVKTLPDLAAMVQKLCPDVNVAKAHGQMDPKVLEATLIDFIEKKYDVLVSTNIIETGLDIPNANTIIINNAHEFGLSDLHQLRGRVGRSNKKAFCYLFSPPFSTLTQEARKRLQTLEEFSELGSGFNIAMRDLDIRGAGNLLGAEQSGFIADIGYETYQKILEEAVRELKESDFKDVFREELESNYRYVRDVQIDTDVEMRIPDDYVSSIPERLNLYTQLDLIESDEDLDKFAEMLRDRFGPVPDEVFQLFDGLRLRWICRDLGVERLILKNSQLKAFYVLNAQSDYYSTPLFRSIANYLNQEGYTKLGLKFSPHPRYCIMVKEKGGVNSLHQAKTTLQELLDNVSKPEKV